ncbi:MAG TPA: hypothetical protein VLM38_16000 [Blastocatellia bacterium]|nr:hypothetical protein [Blastocatellia bacterium]
MLRLIPRSTARSLVAVLLAACVFALTAPRAAAADSNKDADRDASTATEASRPRRADASANVEAKSPNVLYAAFDGAASLPAEAAAEAAVEPASRPRSVARLVTSVNEIAGPIPARVASPFVPQASTAPMTAKEKFGYFFHSRFLSWGSYASAAASGLYKEALDNDDFKKDTAENFFADSATRTARSFAFGTTASFYEKAVLASLFRQDPRYHRSQKTGAGAKIGYAVSRVFVTQGDRCACNQFNASYLLGGAAAAVTANLWERSERTGPVHTLSRWYNHIAITALFNIMREFVGGQ